MLNIAYITNRLDPKIEWFFDSLHVECAGDYEDIRLIVVDFFADKPGRLREILGKAYVAPLVHVPPKPTVWQGRYRRTSKDYFAAANARNTALLLAQDGHIAYVDDLSVLVPGWMNCVRDAVAHDRVTFGCYNKVNKLHVSRGHIISYEAHDEGRDPRVTALASLGKSGLQPCAGQWLFGCSLVAPVEAFLDINGWDEDCDSMGAEDYAAGIMLDKAGYACHINTDMQTIEDEALHWLPGVDFPRPDKLNVRGFKDGSAAYLHMLLNGRNTAPNYFGVDGIRPVRAAVLAGAPLPVCRIPEHDWRDGQPLSDM